MSFQLPDWVFYARPLSLKTAQLSHILQFHWAALFRYRSTDGCTMDRFEGEGSSIPEKRYKEFLNIEFCPSKRYNIESLLTRQDGSEIIQIKTHQWYLTSNQSSIYHRPKIRWSVKYQENVSKKGACNGLLRSHYRWNKQRMPRTSSIGTVGREEEDVETEGVDEAAWGMTTMAVAVVVELGSWWPWLNWRPRAVG